MKPRNAEAQFATRVRRYAQRSYGKGFGNGIWTNSIKRILCRMGRAYGMRVAACGIEGCHWGEWLFDLCWYSVHPDGYSLRRLELAVELEWSQSQYDRQIDFEKLLATRAESRWFVFEGSSASAVQRSMDKLSLLAEQYGAAAGDRYLLVGLDSSRRDVLSRVIALGD
jgi:hypothetical protein